MKHSRGGTDPQEIFYLLSLETDNQLEISRKRVLFVIIDRQNIWQGNAFPYCFVTVGHVRLKNLVVLTPLSTL